MSKTMNYVMDIEDLVWKQYEKLPADNRDFILAANSASEIAEEMYGSYAVSIIENMVDNYYGAEAK